MATKLMNKPKRDNNRNFLLFIMASLGGIIFNYGYERLLFNAFKNSIYNLLKPNIKGSKNGELTAILNRLTAYSKSGV